MKWQPIETAPKDGSVILCAWFDDDGTTYAIAGWYEPGIADLCWYDQYDDAICPTHWLPLPPAPETKS